MSEKKWFIYVGDHHEGPFTVSEIWDGIDANKFQKSAFVWAEGMQDWVALVGLPEFERAAPEPPSKSVPPVSNSVPTPVTAQPIAEASSEPSLSSNWNVESAPAATPDPVLESRAAYVEEIKREPTLTNTKTGTLTTVIEVGDLESASRPAISRPAVVGEVLSTRPSVIGDGAKAPFFHPRFKPVIYAILVIAALGALQRLGVLRGVEDRISSMLSTIPELSDVTPEEYADLKKVVKAPKSAGPQVALALSKADPLAPIFYVATNLPDGTKFEIYIEGISHRILNTLSFSGKLEVTTLKHFAKSSALRYPDGKPIPRGEHVVYVMEAPSGQPDLVYKELLQLAPIPRTLPNHLPQERRLVISKKIFFGSKDASYETRLKEFHDGLVDKAKKEVTELAQTLVTLDSQALVSISTYDRLKKQPIGPKQKQVWNEMNRTWRPVETQVIQKYAGLSADQIKENYFHWNLVSEFIAVEKILSDLHSAQEKLFTTSATAAGLETEINWLRGQFETRKGLWKAAIEKVLANPADPETGLPVKITIETPTEAPKDASKGN